MTRIHWCAASLLALMSAGCPPVGMSDGGCSNDSQCNADRICMGGQCVAPDDGDETAGSDDAATDPTASGPGDTSDDTQVDTSDGADGETTTGGEVPLQPYGRCLVPCGSNDDCSGVGSIAVHECIDGVCAEQCDPEECEANDFFGGEQWSCVDVDYAPPGTGACRVTCNLNSCPDVTASWYCSLDEGFSEQYCGQDCLTEGESYCVANNNDSGAACLPTVHCGCYGDADCDPGLTCYRRWQP